VELLYREIECEAEYQVMPGVGDLLETLSQRDGVALGLQTGNLEEAVPAKLNRGGLTRYFACGGFGTDSSSRPEIIRTAIARTRDAYQIASAQQTDVIVIGDAPQDVGAAMEVGVRSIAVTTGVYSAKELAAAGPYTVLADLSDVQGVISLLGV
jgi:phosphoglycolate phosphatase-like HAD superfamily hydrolase